MNRITLSVLFLFILLLSGCFGPGGDSGDTKYRRDMRQFVQGISAYARGIQAGFIGIPQNGGEILTVDGEPTDTWRRTISAPLTAWAGKTYFTATIAKIHFRQ